MLIVVLCCLFVVDDSVGDNVGAVLCCCGCDSGQCRY